VDQFSSIISILDLNPTGSLFVDHVDHDLFVKNTRFLCIGEQAANHTRIDGRNRG
jgi:hypothetical protein